MSAEYEDLPIPTARERVMGKWSPDTTRDEKIELILEEESKRMRSLLFLIAQECEQDSAFNGLLRYILGAGAQESQIQYIASDVFWSPEILSIFKKIESYISSRSEVPERYSIQSAHEQYLQIKENVAEKEHAEQEATDRIIFAIKYFRESVLSHPLAKEFGMYLFKKKIGGTELCEKAAHDPQAREVMAALDDFVCADERIPMNAELSELEDLLQEV
jgi:hypothetical protein